ncbi:hypothetical protein C2E23DRAFT_113262 [Lenzites betulinus]|nr:hypothetical protein C2E23DRAFT_113262 [Lenzites betulinus]
MSLFRSLSLAGSLVGALCNLAFALRLLALSRSLGSENESEWEGSIDVWAVDSVRLVWGMLFVYFAVAAASCTIGFIGLAKHVRQFVRVYRDYSIADFVFVTLATLAVSYTTFHSSSLRSTVCEELTRHPELMRDMGEMGLSLENCEQWFERAVVAVLGVMFILIVVRLHIVIALSQYYGHLSREFLRGAHARSPCSSAHVPLQRIYLVNPHTSPAPTSSTPGKEIAVYATVPVGSMSEEEARSMHAMEAWIAPRHATAVGTPRAHRHSHSHSHSHGHSHRHSTSGRNSARSGARPDEEKGPLVEL